MRITIWLAALTTTAMLVLSCVPGMAKDEESRFDALKRFSQVLDMVERYYVRDVTRNELVNGAISGMLQALDPHSTFLDKEEYRSMQEKTSGEFYGIGIEITQDESGVLKVVAPIDDTPAFKAGLKTNDLILEVDGTPTQDMSLSEAVSRIKGPKGTHVRLTVLQSGASAPKEFDIIRDTIPLIAVRSRELADGYLWVRLVRFSDNTTDELHQKVREYADKKELKGIILDMRNNPGGLLDQAISVSDAFLSSGTIVSIKGRAEESREFSARKQSSDITTPLVVLLNAGSASASEIVAGALRDHKRALLLGEPSFGKGSVQNIIPMTDGSAVKMTIALYYTPNGTSIQAEGITPDIEIPFVQAAEADSAHPLMVRERDLSRHLENGNGPKKGKAKEKTAASEAQEFLARDNQLRLGLQLVKTLPRLRSIQ